MEWEALREAVRDANRAIASAGLAPLTWGNASGIDRDGGIMAIKPSGVAYEALRPEDIVLVEVAAGVARDAALRPSSDTRTHLRLYEAFPQVGGIVHSHSVHATAWAQAGRAIPCLGTTHADHFAGDIPIVRFLDEEEIDEDYEGKTGESIVEYFRHNGIDPLAVPGALVSGHGPFAWGETVSRAVENAIALEKIAELALLTLSIVADLPELPAHVRDKHFQRKHGPEAYYGQGSSDAEPR